jgi:hypothetical protein
MELEPGDRSAPRTCNHCHAVGSLTKERRYAQYTVHGYRAKLFVFFDWLKINRMIVTNPVQRKVAAPNPSIQHYPPEVIRQLCGYSSDPLELDTWQNGYAERLMRTIKEEEVDLSDYQDYADAMRQIGRFLDEVYMHKRIHSSLGYLTPAEFESQWRQERSGHSDMN